jgi:rod shape determining protein RodA
MSTIALSLIGLVMVYSVTKAQAPYIGVSQDHYLIRQSIFLVIGILVLLFFVVVDYRMLEVLGVIFYGFAVLMLLAVMTSVGSSALGAQRWFQLGPIQLQPSEFAVLAVIFIVAFFASKEELIKLRTLVKILLFAGIPVLLVYKQPDLGTAIILGVTIFTMLIVANTRGRHLFLMFALLIVGVAIVLNLGILKQYQVERLTAFLHPKNAPPATVYNLQQSEIAIGSGGALGTGFGKGSQTNLAFVPEQQTDFIFTAVGEQLGFVGSATVLGLFFIMCWRLIRAISLSRDMYGKLLVAGGLGSIAFSVFQNTAMTVGLMPITGIPLPFMSYGGSSAMVFFAIIGIALNVEMRRK